MMENIEQRVKALINQHLDSDEDVDAGDEEFIMDEEATCADEDRDEEDEGGDDEEYVEDLGGRRTMTIDFEQKSEKTKSLRMRGFVFEEYESNLELEPESPTTHYTHV